MINWSTNSPADNEQAFSFSISPTDTELREGNEISTDRLRVLFPCCFVVIPAPKSRAWFMQC